jgi:molybdopterin synthase sulfur carrier subunit
MTIEIHVKYFASIRELMGFTDERVRTSAQTVGELRLELIARSEQSASALSRSRLLRVAVNQIMCDETEVLAQGCEVAFFPPVTGG